ncbi:MAG: SusC/RagA family TonB-linked outer membrane protein [Bacteroidales bacterium]|nr:SusC/RagA family TonB-linked outer membrane protein [Bacteroidales bacterium]
MKKLTFLLFLIGFFSFSMFSQTTVIGKVMDENGEGIPGAIVKVKSVNVATMTDFGGSYSITVPEGGKTLVYSFTGRETVEKEISGTEMDINLFSADKQITEVKIIGMGIKRDEKKIGYAVSTVDGDDVVKSRTSSAMNALQGKIPGVNITTASGAPGASTRVIFRGFSTLYGSNQPLYIIDGIPVNNGASGSISLNGGTDFGNQANDVNPNDIESISFLKGSAATAIYGNRAANGVVIITTKSGDGAIKGMEITINSSAQFSTPLRLPQFQNLYGQGIFGNWDLFENTSYGPKYDNKLHYWGHVVDGERLIKPYSALPNNVADFFEVGKFFQNSVSISGGSKSTSYRFSFSNVLSDGIMPYNQDWYNRNTASFHGATKLSNKISSEASVTYVNKKNRFVPTGQGGQSVWNNVLQQPRDIPIIELANIEDKFFNNDNYYSPYTTNPYWPLLENGNNNNEDRVYGMVSLTYDVSPNLKIMCRLGEDVSNRQLKEWRAYKINSIDGRNFDVDNEEGFVSTYTQMRNQLNSDLLATYSNNFGHFSLNALVGHNLNQQLYQSVYQGAVGISVPNFYHISNTYGTPSVSEYSSIYRLVGVYGNVELSYMSWLTLAVSARNDWSSTLPHENNSFFYPGVSLGWVFTDAFNKFEDWKKVFSYGKIRVSYGQTGNDAGVYSVYPYLYQPGRFPLPSNVNAFSEGNSKGNDDLRPELTSEFEVGTDLRFINGKYRIDFTYYDKTIKDLIFNVEKASSTGYTYQTTNLGSIRNHGVELLVSSNFVERENLNITFTVNFSINRSEVVELGAGMESYDIFGLLGGTEHYFRVYPRSIDATTGETISGSPIGVFEISAPEIYTDDNGEEHVVVNPQGVPKLATSGYDTWGKSEYDFMSGFILDMRIFKIINVSATVDWRQGGWMHSRTAGMVYFTGTTPATLYNDRQPFVVPNSVIQVDTDDDGNPVYVENTVPVLYDVLGGSANSYWDLGGTLLGGHELVSKTFVKLRDVSISVNVPNKWLQKSPFGMVSVGFVGNNLLLWTPATNNFIDPELTTYGNDLYAEFGEFGATPSVRTLGFSLTVKF